jgi:hypothetical protein
VTTGLGEEPPAAEQPAAFAQSGPLLLWPSGSPVPQNAEKPDPAASTLSADIEQLKQEHAALRSILNEANADSATAPVQGSESAKQLRLRLEQMSSELRRRQSQPKADGAPKRGAAESASAPSNRAKAPSAPSPANEPELEHANAAAPDRNSKTEAAKPVDPISLGHVMLQMDDYEGAVQAFRVVELTKLRADDRAYVQYLLATALRSAGRTQDALPLYREVANSKADVMIAECARWQISMMQWRRDLETQLDTMRQRRRSLLPDLATPESDSPQEMSPGGAPEESP